MMKLRHVSMKDTGEDVKILQEKLKILGFYAGRVTGSFGNATDLALRKFQDTYDLKVTGIVNNSSWDLLFSETKPIFIQAHRTNYKTIKEGDSGEEVYELQIMLKTLNYYEGAIDEIFGSETVKAVKNFQYINQLTVDGVVGKNTWAALYYLYSPTACFEEEISVAIELEKTMDEDFHTVVTGDTLWSVAKKHGLTVDELKEINHLSSNNLTIDQILKLSTESTLENSEMELENKYMTYAVIKDDTLYSLARQFDTTVEQIKNLNNLSSSSLSVGQILLMPDTSVNYITYVVKSSDTLYALAREYNTTIDAIKSLNDLIFDNLQMNQILKIPRL